MNENGVRGCGRNAELKFIYFLLIIHKIPDTVRTSAKHLFIKISFTEFSNEKFYQIFRFFLLLIKNTPIIWNNSQFISNVITINNSENANES